MNKFKTFLKKFFLINDTPHKVAAGAALGVFLGIFPGEGLLSTLFFATILRFNRLSATTALLATNMWTTLFVLPTAAIVGATIFGENASKLESSFSTTLDSGWKFFFNQEFFFNIALPLLVGFFIVSGAIALAIYFLLYFLLKFKKKPLEQIKIKDL